jgi:Cytidine and deoxycytidylate deaminase zinc-binding region
MESGAKMEDMPGIKDLIEFSRSVHAEMNALLNCARSGVSPEKGVLYCTTFPCHYCARHLIAAGLSEVYFVEPYVKSLATELHRDAIATEVPLSEDGRDKSKKSDQMLVVPFTGVGPRMYEDFFLKRGDLKNDETGEYVAPRGEIPAYAVRLNELAKVEQAAAELVPDS